MATYTKYVFGMPNKVKEGIPEKVLQNAVQKLIKIMALVNLMKMTSMMVLMIMMVMIVMMALPIIMTMITMMPKSLGSAPGFPLGLGTRNMT